MTLVQEVEIYGPLFEHMLGLKPWDLERMTRAQVSWRLDWLKRQRESGEAALNG